MSDTVDIKIDDIIYCQDKNNQNTKVERPPWVLLGREISRSQFVFCCQIVIICLVVLTSIINLIIAQSCEQTTLWVAILSSALGYILPSPK